MIVLAFWVEFHMFTEQFIIIRQLTARTALFPTIIASIVLRSRHQQNPKQLVFLFDINEFFSELCLISNGIIDNSRKVSDDLMINLFVGGAGVDKEELIRCYILPVSLA